MFSTVVVVFCLAFSIWAYPCMEKCSNCGPSYADCQGFVYDLADKPKFLNYVYIKVTGKETMCTADMLDSLKHLKAMRIRLVCIFFWLEKTLVYCSFIGRLRHMSIGRPGSRIFLR